MNTVGQKYSESNLLLKSFCLVAGIAAFVLLFMRHEAPARSGDKAYGGGVRLLLTRNIAEADEFYRWAELNKPSNVFGYNSKGLFTRSVEFKRKTFLPEVRSFVSAEQQIPLPEVPPASVLAVKMEKFLPAHTLLQADMQKDHRGFAVSGIGVFSEKGEHLCNLPELESSGSVNPLLLRAEHSLLGTRFQIVESSGDTEFDSRVTAALEQKIRSGSRFSGILAVWPKEEKGK